MISAHLTSGLHHVGQSVDLGEDARQLRDVLYLQRGVDHRQIILLPRQRLNAQHVDSIIGHEAGDIAHEPGAVIGADLDLDRERLVGLGLPLHFDQLLVSIPADLVDDIRTTGAMDGDAPVSCDVADDRVAGYRIAAARQVGHDAVDALDLDAAAGRTPVARSSFEVDIVGPRLIFLRLTLPLQRALGNLLGVHLAIANGGQEIVHLLVAKQLHDRFEAVCDGEAFYLLFQQMATALDILIPVLLAQPGADLAAGALGGDVFQVGIQPVAAGAASFGGDDADLVAVLQFVVQCDQSDR